MINKYENMVTEDKEIKMRIINEYKKKTDIKEKKGR